MSRSKKRPEVEDYTLHSGMKLYICSTDYQHELKDVPHTVKFFKSVKRLKEVKSCWKECGITEIEVVKTKEVVKGTL